MSNTELVKHFKGKIAAMRKQVEEAEDPPSAWLKSVYRSIHVNQEKLKEAESQVKKKSAATFEREFVRAAKRLLPAGQYRMVKAAAQRTLGCTK